MKKLYLFLALVLGSFIQNSEVFSEGEILPLPEVAVKVISDEINPEMSPTGIFSMLGEINDQQSLLANLEANEQVIRNKQASLMAERSDLLSLEQDIEAFIFQLQQGDTETQEADINVLMKELSLRLEPYFPNIAQVNLSAQYLQSNYKNIRDVLTEQQNKIDTQLDDISTELTTLQKQIDEATIHLERLQGSFHILLKQYLRKALYFILSIIAIIIFTRLLIRVFQKRSSMPDEKQAVLASLITLTRNIVIFVMIVVFFFSEFLTILPVLAIVGTGIGFALRDLISSFIAWFVIGMKDTTFKLGDIIEIPRDDIFGQVKKIHPLVTTVKELGLSGPNSKFRTFPNKLIFETSLNNLSKHYGWVYIPMECMLTFDSDVVHAKELLKKAMDEVVSQDEFTQPEGSKARLKRTGIDEAHMLPEVFSDVRTQGIFLRGKMLVRWEERHEIRNQVVQRFTKAVKKAKDVELRYVDFWVNDLR